MLWCNYISTQFTTHRPCVMWALLFALWAHSTMAAIIITYRGLRKTNTPNMRLTLTPVCLPSASLALCSHDRISHWPNSDSDSDFILGREIYIYNRKVALTYSSLRWKQSVNLSYTCQCNKEHVYIQTKSIIIIYQFGITYTLPTCNYTGIVLAVLKKNPCMVTAYFVYYYHSLMMSEFKLTTECISQ